MTEKSEEMENRAIRQEYPQSVHQFAHIASIINVMHN
jgi:hypothetical protein